MLKTVLFVKSLMEGSPAAYDFSSTAAFGEKLLEQAITYSTVWVLHHPSLHKTAQFHCFFGEKNCSEAYL